MEQIAAVLGAVAESETPLASRDIADRFRGGRNKEERVAQILALLAAQRLVLEAGEGRYAALPRPVGTEEAA